MELPQIEVAEGTDLPLLSQQTVLRRLSDRIDVVGEENPVSELHFTRGRFECYWSELILPFLQRASGTGVPFFVDPFDGKKLPTEGLPVVWLDGKTLTERNFRSLLRLESSGSFSELIRNSQRKVVFFLSRIDAIGEPIHAHFNSLLKRTFSPAGDPFVRSRIFCLIHVDWESRESAGVRNLLAPGMPLSRFGIEPW